MLKACPVCATPGCTRHTKPKRNHWSPNRDRTAQARMRRQLQARAGNRCENCGATKDLRACHITPLRDGGTYDPTNGQLLCRTCDKATDHHAR